MPLISIKPSIQIDLQAIVDGLSDLDTSELEAFAEEVNILLARRKAPSLSKKETELLAQINKGIPAKILERFQSLREKQKASTLSQEEQMELSNLVDQIENQEAKRLESMIALASIWNISIDQLRERLGIQSPEPHVW